MPHEIYDVNKRISHWGNRGQTGGAFYKGYRFQVGRGVLGVLGRYMKYIIPWVRQNIAPMAQDAYHAIKQEGLEAGSKVLSEIAKGQDPKEAIVTEGTEALKNLVRKAGTKMKGGGRRKSTKSRGVSKNARSLSHLHAVGRSLLNSSAKRGRSKELSLY